MPQLIQEIYRILLKEGVTVRQFLDYCAIWHNIYDDCGNIVEIEFEGFDNPAAGFLYECRKK